MARKTRHSMDIEECLRSLQSSLKGLSPEEAEKRLREYGPNELVERKRISPFKIFLNQFKDIFIAMLLIATAISFLVGESVDAITISAIVILNAIVGFVQEYRSEKAMEALKKYATPKARVIREGIELQIAARDVVPGDIIVLESGDRIPADGRLIETIELKVDEAVLTGESTPVTKTTEKIDAEAPIIDRKNMVFMGTHVVYGRGKALVTATGMKTEFGKIAEMVQEAEEEKTPLKIKLEKFAKRLGFFIIAVSVVLFILEILDPNRQGSIIDAFLITVALAVSAVPEGLPAIVTVTLALGARELAKRNSIIRRLSSVETLGSTTVICSDKTGTLTKGEMTVRRVYVNNEVIEVTGVGYEPKGEFLLDGRRIDPKKDEDLALLLRIGSLCNNASLQKIDGVWQIAGDTTEGALITLAKKAGIEREELESAYKRIGEIPFSSERKRMTTIHAMRDGQAVAYVKGASEVVLERCSRILINGREEPLKDEDRARILKINEDFAKNALRVLGAAYKKLPHFNTQFDEEVIESDLVFVGLFGMIDPPREEVKEAVQLCYKAGIKVVMITGDHKITAMAVAKELNILKGGLIVTGEELDNISDEELERIVEDIEVYARVSPQHKLRIVRALKKKGHIVAMTGDGVNDAPALKNADIGIAMGITGTDVSKEASDMVLADDNFATIVNAVEGGRIIYDNIRKFIRFLLSCNFAELIFIAVFVLLGYPLPLLPSMVLWINLVTDGGPAIALSIDPPVENVMHRPPRNPKEGLLYGMTVFIIASTLLNFVGESFIFSWEYFISAASLERARTMTFMFIAMFELIVVWNCRSERHNAFKIGFLSNKFLLLAVLSSFLLTAFLCYIPVLQVMFHTVPLTLYDWVIIFATASLGFAVAPEIFMGKITRTKAN